MTSLPKHAPEQTPPCPHFGPCGGCQLQHLTYPTQLAGKADRLRTLLAAAVPNPPEFELHASPPFGYRNRIRLTLARQEGTLRAGYLRAVGQNANSSQPTPDGDLGPPAGPDQPAGHAAADKTSFLPITQCPIAAPVLWRTAEAFLALALQPLGSWLHDRHLPDQLELFATADESRLNLTLSLRTTSRTLPDQIVQAFTAFCEALRVEVPALSGAGISLLPPASRKRSRRGEAPRPGPVWGAAGLNYAVAAPQPPSPHDPTPNPPNPAVNPSTPGAKPPSPGLSPHSSGLNPVQTLAYWVPRTAFFQVNRFLIPDLVAFSMDQAAAAPKKSLAWDLYAGAGLFSRPLTTLFEQVTAVEIAEAASTALGATRLPNLQAVQSTTLDFLRNAVLQRERPDFVLLDPPRTGAGPEVCTLLGRIAAPTLIYVSCSPDDLALDLRTLIASGYTLVALHLLDLFPQTTHIETIAILTR